MRHQPLAAPFDLRRRSRHTKSPISLYVRNCQIHREIGINWENGNFQTDKFTVEGAILVLLQTPII